FFFQAEDGIRDKLVTGVQTCALPISPQNECRRRYGSNRFFRSTTFILRCVQPSSRSRPSQIRPRLEVSSLIRSGKFRRSCRSRRSEERRVGKECRYGGGA